PIPFLLWQSACLPRSRSEDCCRYTASSAKSATDAEAASCRRIPVNKHLTFLPPAPHGLRQAEFSAFYSITGVSLQQLFSFRPLHRDTKTGDPLPITVLTEIKTVVFPVHFGKIPPGNLHMAYPFPNHAVCHLQPSAAAVAYH